MKYSENHLKSEFTNQIKFKHLALLIKFNLINYQFHYFFNVIKRSLAYRFKREQLTLFERSWNVDKKRHLHTCFDVFKVIRTLYSIDIKHTIPITKRIRDIFFIHNQIKLHSEDLDRPNAAVQWISKRGTLKVEFT